MLIMFSFEVEIFRGGGGFLYLLFPWLLKVLTVNSVNWQYFHVTRHVFQWQSFGFLCCLGMSLFGVKPPQIFTKLCAVYSLYPQGAFWKSLLLSETQGCECWHWGLWVLWWEGILHTCLPDARLLGALVLSKEEETRKALLTAKYIAPNVNGSWGLGRSFQVCWWNAVFWAWHGHRTIMLTAVMTCTGRGPVSITSWSGGGLLRPLTVNGCWGGIDNFFRGVSIHW